MTRRVRVIRVVETVSKRGDGKSQYVREVVEYWDFRGRKLAEFDPCAEEEDLK